MTGFTVPAAQAACRTRADRRAVRASRPRRVVVMIWNIFGFSLAAVFAASEKETEGQTEKLREGTNRYTVRNRSSRMRWFLWLAFASTLVAQTQERTAAVLILPFQGETDNQVDLGIGVHNLLENMMLQH